MEPKNNDEIVIYDEEGKEYLMNILFTYENEERNSQYVFVYDKGNPDDVFVMKYTDDSDELFEVTDEEELAEAQEVLDAYNDDPTIQEIKD